MTGHQDPREDREQVADLLARYCLALDRHEVETWVGLFTPGAVYHVYGRSFEGHDGLRAMATAAPHGLHLGGPAVIEVEGDTATTQQNLLFLDVATGELRGAVYDDELVRTSGGWRFASRRCRFITPDGLRDRPARAT